MKNASGAITSPSPFNAARRAKTASKFCSVLAGRMWSCSPRVWAAASRSCDIVCAIRGLVGLTRSTTAVAAGATSRSNSRLPIELSVQVGHASDIAPRPGGVRTRTSYGWLATQPRLVCSGCFRDMPLDCAELALWLGAIDEAVKPLDELTAELMRNPLTRGAEAF